MMIAQILVVNIIFKYWQLIFFTKNPCIKQNTIINQILQKAIPSHFNGMRKKRVPTEDTGNVWIKMHKYSDPKELTDFLIHN